MIRKLLVLIILLLVTVTVQAQEDIFLPIILKSDDMAINPRLVITDGTIEVDLLSGGWKLADPYWNPQIANYKGGGTFVNAQLAEGRQMVHQEYDNVIETIPLSLRGIDQAQAMATAHEALALLRQAGDYWTKPYEYDPVWIEVKLPCNACLTGYSRVIKGTIPELTNPFGQPFFSTNNESVMEDITLTIERQPFWQVTKPGEIIGPFYNLIDNPDFELWNNGVVDSQPDSWDDLETTHIAGQNSRDQSVPKFGQSALKVRVSGSTLAGAAKGVTQVLNDTNDFTEYTVIAWVRSEGVSNGVGRILVTYNNQLELYRSGDSSGWTLYTGKITTGYNDNIAISIEILTTAANTDGTIYVDGLMFIEGDWEQEAIDNILPYMSGSHIVNHWDREAGDINWVDAWNVPGNVSALTRVEFVNNMSTLDINLDTIRMGLRRANDVFQFENYQDIPGINDTESSNNDSADFISISNEFSHLITKTISGINEVLQNAGRFRAYARIKEKKASGTNTLRLRMTYGNGAEINKSLDEALVEVFDDWTSVDLTESRAVIFETKPNNNLGQIGYKVEAKRDTGSEGTVLDYIMLMPTDGGFVEINNAALSKGNALIVGSDESNYVRKGWGSSGWNLLYNDGQNFNQEEGRITSYRGQIYFDRTTKMFRIEDGVVTDITPSFVSGASSNHMSGYGEYEGFLYIKNMVGDTFTLYRSGDGITWEEMTSVTRAGELAFATSNFIAFDDKLFFAVHAVVNGDTLVYAWDGTTLTSSPVNGASIIGNEFAIFGGELYYANRDNIRKYDKDLGTWSIVASSPDGASVRYRSMSIFDGKIFLFDTTRVEVYDGSDTITQVFVKTSGAAGIISSVVFDDKLYGGLIAGNTGDIATGLVSSDGEDFSLFSMPFGTRTAYLYNFDGVLYVLASSVSPSPSPFWLFTLSSRTVLSTVPNWSGRTFLSPPRTYIDDKRQRFFFNYNRTDRINNIDDGALIGIGFVPRYLELPMCEN